MKTKIKIDPVGTLHRKNTNNKFFFFFLILINQFYVPILTPLEDCIIAGSFAVVNDGPAVIIPNSTYSSHTRTIKHIKQTLYSDSILLWSINEKAINLVWRI